jgi:hypothetical protein
MMFKKIALIVVLSVVAGLWPGRGLGLRPGNDGFRHIAGLAGHSAVLVTSARAGEQGESTQHPSTAVAPGPASVCARVCAASKYRAVSTFPFHPLATHLLL